MAALALKGPDTTLNFPNFRFWLSGVESMGQHQCDWGFLSGSTPVLGVIDQGFRFWGGSELQLDQICVVGSSQRRCDRGFLIVVFTRKKTKMGKLGLLYPKISWP